MKKLQHNNKRTKGLHSQNQLAAMFGHDRRTVSLILRGVKAAGTARGFPVWSRERFIEARETYTQETGGASPLRRAKLTEEIRKLRIRNDRQEAVVVGIGWIRKRHAFITRRVNQILNARLEAWAELVGGLDVPGARTLGKQVGDLIRGDIQRLPDEFAKEP